MPHQRFQRFDSVWYRVNPSVNINPLAVKQVVPFNPSPNKPLFFRVSSLLKTLWEKEKLLVMSNFFFSNSVFYVFREFSPIFIKFKNVVCKHFQNGRV